MDEIVSLGFHQIVKKYFPIFYSSPFGRVANTELIQGNGGVHRLSTRGISVIFGHWLCLTRRLILSSISLQNRPYRNWCQRKKEMSNFMKWMSKIDESTKKVMTKNSRVVWTADVYFEGDTCLLLYFHSSSSDSLNPKSSRDQPNADFRDFFSVTLISGLITGLIIFTRATSNKYRNYSASQVWYSFFNRSGKIIYSQNN